ncbi:DUF2198 family protein [Lysinibacillus irui]|uniref:DUF2198 family protein n=1 Tax=Lysinibacillus irui TaxID=2998077 RepID=A0AAJ5RLY8_9BACI|nr:MULTISPECIES: DUF2198 family protein [Lysinibacillus]MEA0554097.1 DUF2198 family protein [Lysinibacillus irui]MEA0561828.1 DUF2198 family protein [Lysinibacillus irui]MEA0974961.1 DUF2198 family protein [Lysinibacillus irui]MEA1041115.1 DUF2198 family protein [Lysinibacillus irui]WDV07500.1 DUF2198 family protein [Lysinibacillus irui]
MDVFGKMMLALFIPALLVLLFTRITYNRYVALVLAIALIAASVYAGYTSPSIIFVIDAFSLTVGFWLASKLKK